MLMTKPEVDTHAFICNFYHTSSKTDEQSAK